LDTMNRISKLHPIPSHSVALNVHASTTTKSMVDVPGSLAFAVPVVIGRSATSVKLASTINVCSALHA